MGIVTALLSAIFSTSKDLYSKQLAGRMSSTLSTFTSFAYALPYYAIFLLALWLLGYEDFALGPGFFLWIVLRALSDAAAEWLKMKAFSFGDLSLVSSFLSLSPLFILITSPVFTGDPLTVREVVAIVIIVSGTLLLIPRKRSSGSSATSRQAIACAIGAALFFSLNTCFDRLAVQTASPSVAAFSVTAIAALLFAIPALRQPDVLPVLRGNQRLLLGRGFFEIAFMVAKLYALTQLSAPTLVGIQRVSLVFSIIAGRVVFREDDFFRRLMAGLLIFVGVLGIMLWP